jgi:hypothetical protein
MIYSIVYGLLALSLALNIYQFYQSTKINKGKMTYDARALLHDLSRDASVIRVERIAPEEFFLRSPQ